MSAAYFEGEKKKKKNNMYGYSFKGLKLHYFHFEVKHFFFEIIFKVAGHYIIDFGYWWWNMCFLVQWEACLIPGCLF